MHEVVRKTHGAERQADGLLDVALARDGQFATPAAEIHHQHWRRIYSGRGSQSQMDEPSFLQSGDNFDSPSGSGTHPFEKCAGVPRIAQRAGCHYADRVGSGTLARAMKTSQHFDRERDCPRRKKTAAKYRFAEARDLSVFVNFYQVVRCKAGNLKADRVRSDVNSGKSRHSRTVYRIGGMEIE